jgi:hypothetical protein
MQGTQFLAGWKTYGVMVLALAYAAYGYFYAHTLDAQTALGIAGAALGLGGLRSALTTEAQKMLAAFGINPQVNASTVTGLEDRALQNITDFLKSKLPSLTKTAVVIFCMFLVSPMLQGCQSWAALTGSGSAAPQLCSTPSQCVYQAKGIFAGSLAIANAYRGLPTCPQGSPICKDPNLLAQIRTQAHIAQGVLDAADELVNSGLLPDGQKATDADKTAAANNATAIATQFKATAAALPH